MNDVTEEILDQTPTLSSFKEFGMHTRLLTFSGLFLLIASPVESQTTQVIGDGVSVVSFPAGPGIAAQNVGWVEFENHLLVIDACDSASWRALAERIQEATAKPTRFVTSTPGHPSAQCDAGATGLTWLVASGADQSEVFTGRTMFPADVALDDGTKRVVLRALRGGGAGETWTVDVGETVLFAGDLVGRGRGSKPLPVDRWIAALDRLERMNPGVVIPGRGPVTNADILSKTRLALSNSRARIAEAVRNGTPRDAVIEALESEGAEFLPDGTVEFLYDEYVGLVPATNFVEELGLREGPSPSLASPGWTPPRKVVVADLWPGRTQQLALAAPGMEVLVASDQEHAAELVEDADAILGWLTPEILERGARLRWVSLFSAGVESYLALPGFRESDVVLTNGQSLYANGGAEHVLGMVLALSRRLPAALRLQGERRWDTEPLTGPKPISGAGSELGELRGKTLLVVGLGGIGTEVARLAHGIGMRVIATRASRREGPSFVEYVGLSSELLSLAPEADVVVNCVPLTPETERMFDDTVFSAMKSTVFFVNIGRGRTVDTDALVRALRNGSIAGAGLDVTEPEPLPADHELWGLPNVIITPHVGGDSEAHMERIWLLFRENLRRFAVGEQLLSVVNKSRGY